MVAASDFPHILDLWSAVGSTMLTVSTFVKILGVDIITTQLQDPPTTLCSQGRCQIYLNFKISNFTVSLCFLSCLIAMEITLFREALVK